jgi:thiol-disulfide isomerase/thioredoxin
MTMKRALAFLFCLPLLATGPLVPINEAGFQKLVDSHKGKVVLYDFWATWCAPCRAEFPQLVLLERKLRSRGVEVVTISADDREHQAAAQKFIQMFDVQGPVYMKQADDDDHFINAIDPKWVGALPLFSSMTEMATRSDPSSAKPTCRRSKPPFTSCCN